MRITIQGLSLIASIFLIFFYVAMQHGIYVAMQHRPKFLNKFLLLYELASLLLRTKTEKEIRRPRSSEITRSAELPFWDPDFWGISLSPVPRLPESKYSVVSSESLRKSPYYDLW